ncbi:actin-like protein 6B [Paramacrobiotus metropolitanus]|uniref:actin-like protein 6B n=1 Tax=Paramacrobiotus metropolitanus TaxID=2943436 RepID=UPI00244647E8|nr:actin-like protein 6B [Paramacrobiotus metropolitanus]XP_055345440.1 actin-like protein 6B [Paramacrobiotus metropolitanus]
MSSQLLVGGDDVNAIVVDYGSSSFRYGHAGEEAPTLVLPMSIGYVEEIIKVVERNENDDVVMTENLRDGATTAGNGTSSLSAATTDASNANGNAVNGEMKKEKRYIVSSQALMNPREGLEIESGVILDGMIDNWDAFYSIMEFALNKHRPVTSSQHPFLFSEPLWITKNKREQLCELMFEKFKASAFYTVKSPVLTCFAHGKSSGLVLDSGKIHTTACAVHEGFCLVPTMVRSPLAGDFISNECRRELERMKIDLTPQYMIKSKDNVELEQPPKYLKKIALPKASTAFHESKVRELVEDFKQILAVSDAPLHDVNPDGLEAREYEFPTGYHAMFGPERFQVPEMLFDPSLIRSGSSAGTALSGMQMQPPSINSTMGMSNLIQNCLTITDQDVRPQLWGNILISGGNSCITGFAERISADCTRRSTTSMKLKCTAATGSGPERSSERLFAPWTGASILGSLGTFQSMWISRSDYEEAGKGIVGKKCP